MIRNVGTLEIKLQIAQDIHKLAKSDNKLIPVMIAYGLICISRKRGKTMLGTLNDVYDSMEYGVYNFCKDGKCIGCGECCSALLPMSDKEIRNIEKYVKKKHIKPCNHTVLMDAKFDLVCPFLDTSKSKDKCKIYPVRPEICRAFKCDTPPSKIKRDKELFWKTRKLVYLWEIFNDGSNCSI